MFSLIYPLLNRFRLMIIASGVMAICISVVNGYVYDVDFRDIAGEGESAAYEHQADVTRENCEAAEREGREPSEADRDTRDSYDRDHEV